MSQDEEDATKYKLKNNNNKNSYQYNNKQNNGHTNRTTTKTTTATYGNLNQQVMPLYENFTINHNNNKNNVKNDHSMVERDPNNTEPFNYEYRFVRNTTDSKSKARDNDIGGITLLSPDDYEEYENVNFLSEKQLDKKLILQKYFRSALVGPRTNIYENLCRGCNYGVFNARGPLCTFCECIVNGVNSIKSDSDKTTPDQESLCTSNNIYENICEYCGLIYSGGSSSASETECKCQLVDNLDKKEEFEKTLGSEELLITKEKKKVKISKSKSFNKANKPKLFANFWDTLRKPRAAAVVKKPIEIIHHVEGFEQVFHTKDTFDLQRICELKRSGTSCSDQHIYGRLKQNDLATSLEEFNSTQSLTQNSTSAARVGNNKKPRISKPKFLRTQSTQAPSQLENVKIPPADVTEKRLLYLNDSVCQWMTSLRREVITYNTNCDEDTLCYPKSIPSKNVLFSYKAPVTNNINNLQNLKDVLLNGDSSNLTEIVTLRRHNSVTSWDSYENEEAEKQHPILQKDCYQLMVEEFITNILNRQMYKNMKAKEDKHLDNVKVMAGVNNNDSHNNNNIPLRQATMTATNNNNNRHKRQGMYLRLEDHPQQEQQQILEVNLHNNNNSNGKEHKELESESESEGNEYENIMYSHNSNKEHIVAQGNSSPVIASTNVVSQSHNQPKKGWDLIRTDKRQGIHESNVLEAFEALLRTEQTFPIAAVNDNEIFETQTNKNESQLKELTKSESSFEVQTFGVNNSISLHFPTQILDVVELIRQQQLSTSLNTAIICYDSYLLVFLRYFSQTNKEQSTPKLYKLTDQQLVRKFHKFHQYLCSQQTKSTTKPRQTMRAVVNVSSNLKLDLNKANGYSMKEIAEKSHESLEAKATNDFKDSKNDKNTSVTNKTEQQRVKTPPQVPKRDPTTKLSPTTENKPIITSSLTPPQQHKKLSRMTKPCENSLKETAADKQQKKEEESIYQPIWNFKTKGEVAERYHTDDDYYDIKELNEKIKQLDSENSEIPKILVSDDNWVPDDDFMFVKKQRSASLSSNRISTLNSSHSCNSSISATSSLSGSTITEFASSTATLASTVSSSLMHHLFRNIGIFYSLTEPKLRAIIYDYDRVHSSSYFAKNLSYHQQINDSGIGKSLNPLNSLQQRNSSNPSSRGSSLTSSPISLNKRDNLCKSSTSLIASESENSNVVTTPKAKVFIATPSTTSPASISAKTSTPTPQIISNSVLAWKRQLLDVNYMEDEEDMVVSESEILRAQKIKEVSEQPPPLANKEHSYSYRVKSFSTEHLDLPLEDDKKSIAERIANMYTRFSPIQRGILNINGRNSPKGEKKTFKSARASQTTSLYLEDGLKPKYPIFGAPLERLELQQNVPRFVVDAVEYIERKDRIIQDGLYRASGNKFLIDELRQKLEKSYIYDSKLIVADDIHTITCLLKQFFRDLTSPLVPQDIYTRITSSLADKQATEVIRIAFEEMREPNKSTLRFLVKHLTNVAVCSSSNRMTASNLAIVWGPSLFAQNDTYDMIGRMNTLTKVFIENYDRIFDTNERLL